ncbi:MAG: hypothetical protein ACOYLQ_17440 [Hyphomicrobiaceae bacterium]
MLIGLEHLTPADIAALTLFAGLGLAGIAHAWLARETTRAGFVIGAMGLAATSAAGTWIVSEERTPEPPPPQAVEASPAQLDDLRDRVLTLERSITAKEGALAIAETAAAEARRSREAAGVKIADLEKALLAEKSSAAARVEEARKAVAAEVERRVAAERATATAVLEARPKQAAQESPAEQLRRKLTNQQTLSYDIYQLDKREVVTGLTGDWYIIRLKVRGKPIAFADRQFRIAELEPEMQQITRALQTDVLTPLGRHAGKVRLFTRGFADSRRVSGPTDPPGVRSLKVLEKRPDGTYAARPKSQDVPKSISNDDLPNLRAAWVKDQLARHVTNAGEVLILANSPAPATERTVDVLLYVRWKEPAVAR